MTVLIVIETLVIAVLGLLVCGLLRSHAEILRALRELEAGGGGAPTTAAASPPPGGGTADVVGTTVDDEAVKIGVVGARHDTLLAFLSSGCLTCETFWDLFRRPERLAVPGGARLVVVTKGPAEESLSRLRELAPRNVAVVMSTAAWEDYDVPVAPYFVSVEGSTGRVLGRGAASTWDQVAALARPAAAGHTHTH